MSLMDLYFNGGGSVRRDRLPNTAPPGTRVGPPSNTGRDRMATPFSPSYGGGFPPNTLGLMQGDLRDTHHYPSGDSSRILAMADERNWDSMPDLADWKQGIGPGARKPIQTIPIFPGTFGDSLEGLINDQTLGNQWAETALNIGDTFPLEGHGRKRPYGGTRDMGPTYEELETIPLDLQFDQWGYPIGQDDWGYIGAARGGLMSLRR